MTISASDVKKLRDMTGAGMMDAKKALSESSGDFDKAVKFLREKGLADSKKLSPKKRTELSNIIKLKAHAFSIATVSARIIDKVNIRNASILAMEKAVAGLKHLPREIIVDGRDSLNSKHPVSTLVKADNLVPEVMAASIIAKVFRDELMMLLDCKYPKYSFGSHKG